MVIRTSVFLVIIIVISKITGFLRDASIAYVYGVSDQLDAYNVGQTVPAVIFGIIASGISTTLLPIFLREEKEKGKEESDRFLNVVISNVTIIVLLIIGLGILFSGSIVKMMAPSYSGSKYALTVLLTMIGFPSVIFTSLGAICTARLQSMNKFMGPSLIGITANVVLIAYLFFFNTHFGIQGFMVATVISYMTEISVMMPILFKSGWRFKFSVDFRHPLFKQMALLTVPVLIGTTVDQINVLVDRILSSGLASGSLSSLNYAYRLYALITSLFASSVGAVLYYSTSKSTAEKDYAKLQNQIYMGLESIILISMPIAFGIFNFAVPIVRVVFERGSFDPLGTSMTSYALMFYSIGIAGVMVRDLLSRTFYSLQDTKTPMLNGFFSVSLNIILSIILVRYMEIGGLALAAGISLNFTAITLYLRMHRKIKITFHKKVIFSLIKSLAASTAMIVSAKAIYSGLEALPSLQNKWGQLLSLGVVAIVAALIYLLLVAFMKFDITQIMVGKVKERFFKNKAKIVG